MMRHKTRHPLVWLTAFVMLFGLLPGIGLAEQAEAPAYPGFILKEQSQFTLVNAQATLFEHEQTGALVLLLENEDTNRTFDISFRTPALNDTGVPHVFEHATLGGSKKYPSKSLFFNLSHQTYNTYMNAMTTDIMTTYPIASLSEDQLLRYADYYLDSVFNPMLMEDASIFSEEAWRYSLPSEDAPLELAGTVYTEMKGAYTINTAARFNFFKTLFPGSVSGNSFGGNPQHIPEMTFTDLTNYHDAYYHPSNSLSILYGKLTQKAEFMQLMDSYFSAFEKKEFTFTDENYVPITEHTEATHEFAVEAGSDTKNGAVVYVGYVLDGVTKEDENVLDLLTTLLNEPSSYFQQEMKKRLPAASAGCYYDNTTPETAVVFSATGMNAEQAQDFHNLVDGALIHIRENGFDKEAVEAVAAATRLDLLLTAEEPNVGPNLLPSLAYSWTADGDVNAYQKYVDNTANYVKFAENGAYQELIERFLMNAQRTAMSITVPVPGLKEQQDNVLAESLAVKKAQMTPEEITELVKATAAFGKEQDDSSQYVKQLQAVTVESLPVEARIFEVSDETGEDKIRRLNATAEVNGVGQVLLLLSAGAIAQEDIHWFKLYTDLLGTMDTQQRDNASLSSSMTRYLYDRQMRISIFTGPTKEECLPFLRVSFKALDEDLAPAYDLVYEVLFESKLDDVRLIADRVEKVKTSLKQTITNQPFNVQIYRAFASVNPGFAYFNYANFLDYYAFLEQVQTLLADNPDEALAKLEGVRKLLHNSVGAVSGFAGNADSQAKNQKTADAFFAKLDREARERAVYDLPKIARSEALIVDSAVQYNLMFAPYDQLGIDSYSGAMDALTSFMSDAFLYPQLRDQYGAYGVQHAATEDGVFLFSYRDPNVTQTFDVYGELSKMLTDSQIEQESLEGYILSAYSGYAASSGELAGALNALVDTIDGRKQERFLTYMEELKGVTVEKVKSYTQMYEELYNKGLKSTSGGAAVINENANLYEVILNPFAIKEMPPSELTDVAEDDWFAEAIAFSVDNNFIEPLTETTFGPLEPLTVDVYAKALNVFLGVGAPAEEIFNVFKQYGMLPPDAAADQTMTREEFAGYLIAMLTAVQVDVKADLQDLPALSDIDQITEGNEDTFRFLLGNELFPLFAEDMLAPKELATRADFAYVLLSLYDF